MGCPNLHYKNILQNFCWMLNCQDERNKAKELIECTDQSALEKEILDKKRIVDLPIFYYFAGRAIECVSDDINNNWGNDAFNAFLQSTIDFETFIGLRKDEDNGE